MASKRIGTDETGIGEPEIIISGDTSGDSGETGSATIEDGIPVIDPSTIKFGEEEPEPRKRRGRPKGSRNSANGKADKKQSTVDLTGVLVSLHTMGAIMTKIPELEIDEDEGKKLAAAITRVNEFYGGVAVPESVLVWGQFVFALGGVYGPRLVAHRNRLKREYQQKQSKVAPVTIDATAN